MAKGRKKEFPETSVNVGGGLFGGLADLVRSLGELAEHAESFSRSDTLEIGEAGKSVKGVFGVSVRVGLGGEGVQVEPFGNVHRDAGTGEAVVTEVREPITDVFEEEDYTLIVAEMPGVGPQDVHVDLKDDILSLHAERGDKRYRKEILLPRAFEPQAIDLTCNNGVVEIRLHAASGEKEAGEKEAGEKEE